MINNARAESDARSARSDQSLLPHSSDISQYDRSTSFDDRGSAYDKNSGLPLAGESEGEGSVYDVDVYDERRRRGGYGIGVKRESI